MRGFTTFASERACLILAIMLRFCGSQSAFAENTTYPITPPEKWVEAPALVSTQSETELQSSMPDRRWWLAFDDPNLAEYIQTATTNSPTLQASLARIAQAKAAVRQAFADQLPTLSAKIQGGQVNIPSSLTSAGSSNASANRSGTSSQSGRQLPFSISRLNFLTLLGSAAYEVDLWGKYRDTTRSARKALKASEADTRAAEVMLQSEVANTYFDVLRAEALYAATFRLVANLQETHALSEALYHQGLETTDTLLRQERDIAAQETDLNDYKQAMNVSAHALSTLTGTLPQSSQSLPHSTLAQVVVPVQLQTGVPLTVIAQRPDVMAQELRLEQAGINVRVARKAFLPTIKVSDAFGMTSVWAGQFLNGSSFLNVLSGNANQTFFQGGKIVANLRMEQARQREQVETYRQTILTALKEVEDSLSSLLKAYEDQQKNDEEMEASRKTLQLTRIMAQNGLRSRLDVLKSENELLMRSLNSIQAKAEKLSATVALYKALGGGY